MPATYFQRLGTLDYDIDGSGTTKTVTAIHKNVKVRDAIKNNITNYYLYDVGDGETPEIISFKAYGTTQHHWIILLFNDIVDPYHDWAMDSQDLIDYMVEKYGSVTEAQTGVHHYEDGDGNEVNNTAESPAATTVTNWTYEQTLNESKRQIKILKPELVTEFVREFESLVSSDA